MSLCIKLQILFFFKKNSMTTMSKHLSMRLSFLSLLLLSCIFASSFTLAVGLAACRPEQIQTLMQFKNEFDFSGCNHTEYLNGVQCDNSTGAVTKLQLPSGCLSGILKPNSSLFRLHHLRYLVLSKNKFISSSLPSEFGKLNKLEVLSLSSIGFIGQIPSSFSNLTKLTELNLSDNELTGSFQLVQNLTKLSILKLSINHFSGTIPSSMLTMPFLSYLNLYGNHLSGSIPFSNSSASSRLQEMDLGGNQFEGQILEPISNLNTLELLSLSFLNISYPSGSKIFSSLKSLRVLDLFGNSLLAARVISNSDIPLGLEALIFPGCDIREFPNILKTLENLQLIHLSGNRIEGKVPEWLWNLPHLSALFLNDNFLNGFEGSTDILVNSSVQVLDLGLNNFKGALPNPPLSIKILSARNNSFTGNIPLSICNRSFFDVLDLSYNNFSGPIPRCLSNLTIVNLRKNSLEGSIPDEFYNGALTHALDVGYNRLAGKLPMSLLNCSFLWFLSVDNNRIEDKFPFWLKALPYLRILTLRSNKFNGLISPPGQGPLGFPMLQVLEISDNNFTGSFPPSYFMNWTASTLKRSVDERIYMVYEEEVYKGLIFGYGIFIDLQYKGLSMEQGRVLMSYITIDFSGNKLEGHIPESIGFLKALIALNLSNNAFTGQIPLSLANVTELESLDLSRNKLSGAIPNGLKTLSFLGYINVSHNQLIGEIPQGTQITGQSKSSFEGNAGLCGLPLEESCVGTNAPPIQHPKQEDEEEDEEEVLNWKAVVIAYGPGLLLGLAIAQVIASFRPKWFVKITKAY